MRRAHHHAAAAAREAIAKRTSNISATTRYATAAVSTTTISSSSTLTSKYSFDHQRHYSHSSSSSSDNAHSSSSSSFSSAFLLTGSLMLAAAITIESTLAAQAESASQQQQPKSRLKQDSPRNITHLLEADFRTLGAATCPELPADAPTWLREQAADPSFQYRNLGAILDVEGHLLYDGLSGERRLREHYYFTEKVLPQAQPANETNSAAAAATKLAAPADANAHTTPHLPPTLDFEPTTPANGSKSQQQEKNNVGWSTSIVNYVTSFFRAAPHSKPVHATSDAATTTASKPASSSIIPTADGSLLHQTAMGPEIRAVFHIGSALCGHSGIIHGGMTAALMDDVSGAATFASGGVGSFTANLNINYIRPIKVERYLLIRAQAVKRDGRKTYVNISVEDGTGGVFARGTALFIKPRMMHPAAFVAATH